MQILRPREELSRKRREDSGVKGAESSSPRNLCLCPREKLTEMTSAQGSSVPGTSGPPRKPRPVSPQSHETNPTGAATKHAQFPRAHPATWSLTPSTLLHGASPAMPGPLQTLSSLAMNLLPTSHIFMLYSVSGVWRSSYHLFKSGYIFILHTSYLKFSPIFAVNCEADWVPQGWTCNIILTRSLPTGTQ